MGILPTEGFKFYLCIPSACGRPLIAFYSQKLHLDIMATKPFKSVSILDKINLTLHYPSIICKLSGLFVYCGWGFPLWPTILLIDIDVAISVAEIEARHSKRTDGN